MPRRPRAATGGFTLVELLVVILIIAILLAIAAPSLLGQARKAHNSTARQTLAISYRVVKAEAVDTGGAWGTSAALCGSGAPITTDEPEIHFQTSFPLTSKDGSGRFNVQCSVASGTLTLTDISGSGDVCTLIVPQNAAIQGPTCVASGAFVPVQVNPNTPGVNYVNGSWSDDGLTIYFDGIDLGNNLNCSGACTVVYSLPAGSLGSTPTAVIDQSASPGHDNSTLNVRNGSVAFLSDRGGATGVYDVLTGPLGSLPAGSAVGLASSTNWMNLSGSATLAPTKFLYDDGSVHVHDYVGAGDANLTADQGVDSGGPEGISPDGNTVVYVDASSGDVMTVATDDLSGPNSLVADGSNGMSSGTAFSPEFSQDGVQIAYGASDGVDGYIVIVNATGGSLVRKLDVGSIGTFGIPGHLKFSPDGSQILFDTANGTGAYSVYVVPTS